MRTFGMTPSPLGPLCCVSEDQRLVRVAMENQRHLPDPSTFGQPSTVPIDVASQLEDYFAGRRQTFELAIALEGTPFQCEVWEALRGIPYGELTTYGELAAALGRPRAVRAVAQAVGRNPLSIIVPCHRVVGADGSLTGFAGGLDRKLALLALEGADRRDEARSVTRSATTAVDCTKG